MDCKNMQKSLIINRFERKMQTSPLKRLAKVQLYIILQCVLIFFLKYLRLEQVEIEEIEWID